MIVGHTLVDASSWSASVLMVNPDADEIVLPCFTCVGNLVPVSSVSVALAEPVPPGEMCETLPDHLEDIVWGRPIGTRLRTLDRSGADLTGWLRPFSGRNRRGNVGGRTD